MHAWKIPGKSPQGNEMAEVYIPEWSQKYGANTFSVDAVTGQMYVKTDEQLIEVAEKCHTKPVVGQEVLSMTPMAGVGIGKETVDTPMSPFLKRDTPPPAESTRKPPAPIQTEELGESYMQVDTGRKVTAF